ncbi:MAG: hypothetical protein DI563_01835 [Variovorax paradoxus]|uniref:GIY-YIG domain-containing protein n=1 Tax=Variovorax paradoxus TaxID=34073 RepID=A0A2W5STA8_VARPD|nr:MAG: hypothetical protein DI563_01835 [Variovorax paradoxus]
MKPFFVYLLRCSDGSYYVGQTEDMDARLQQHGDGLIGYTATRKPIELLWQGEFESRESAIAFERRIKGWSRAKKEALIRGDWPAIQQLARSRAGPNVQPISPELAEVRDGAQAAIASRLRHAQPERARGAVTRLSTARPEPVEGRDGAQAAIASRLRHAQPERAVGAAASLSTVRPEPVEGRDGAHAEIASRLRQAQPERVGGKPMGEAP